MGSANRNGLPAEMNTALAGVLGPDEEVLFVWRGRQTLLGVNRHSVAIAKKRAFGWKQRRLRTYELASLSDVKWGTGRYKWIQFRGPGLDDAPPTLSNLGHHPDAYELEKEPSDADRIIVEGLVAAGLLAAHDTVELPCPACQTMAAFVPSSVSPCAGCGAWFGFRLCDHCHSVNQVPTLEPKRGWLCEFCDERIVAAKESVPDSNGSARLRELVARDMLGLREQVVLVGGFRVSGGSAPALPPLPVESVVSLRTSPDTLGIRREIGATGAWDVPYAAITTIELDGTVTTSDAGIIGGGFGLKAALEGMAVAAVANALTTFTKVDTRLRIGFVGGELMLRHDRIPKDVLRNELSLLWTRWAAARRDTAAPAAPEAGGPTALLAQLAQLHGAGVLTDEEFSLKKAEILRRL